MSGYGVWDHEPYKSILESTDDIMQEVCDGRVKAHEKHGANSIEAVPAADAGRWLAILGEEFGEACSALTYDKDAGNLRAELIDILTVATAWVAAIDREAER